jgi:type IV secretory pathway component VirB8
MTDLRPPTNGELLNRIDKKLAVIESKIDQIADHEDRLRELERARYKSAWITSLASSALSAVIVFVIIKGFTGK